MNKPIQIEELEKTLDIKLTEDKEGDLIHFAFKNRYQLNDKGDVIKLNLSQNGIKDISILKTYTSLTNLDLSYNNIIDIKYLKNLKKLEILNLSVNEIDDINPLKGLNTLRELILSANQIENIYVLKNKTSIKFLDISLNRIKDLTPLYFMNCKELRVENNPLIYPPEKEAIFDGKLNKAWFDENLKEAKELIKRNKSLELKTLDLGNCSLTDIALIPELFNNIHLETLILSNHFADFNDGKWEKVNNSNKGLLNLIYNIPKEISKLKNLKTLIVGGDWKTEEESNNFELINFNFVSELKNLQELNISNNKISFIPKELDLPKLKILHINNNKIKKLNFLNLNNLEELYISNNLIKDIEFILKLSKIKTIDLHQNKITSLKQLVYFLETNQIEILNTSWQKNVINIAKNPIEEPNIETINSGKDAILRYFNSFKDWGATKNKDIKLILVGNSEVGKSTLVKYLDDKKDLYTPHDATHWLQEKTIIKKYDNGNKECVLRIFDFGGHDFYHDTHHLFFGRNTVYILLWDSESNKLRTRKLNQIINNEKINIETQDYPIKYWLDLVNFHSRIQSLNIVGNEDNIFYSYDSQLLMVQNKVEKPSLVLQLNNKKLKNDYPFIYDFVNINIVSKQENKIIVQERNMNHFENIFFEMIENMNVIGSNILEYQILIKEKIESYNDDEKPTMTLQEFCDYCNHTILKDKRQISIDEAKDAVSYLEQIGIIMYYPKNNIDNQTIIYVYKYWILKKIQKILSGLDKTNGLFDKKYIVDIGKVEDKIISQLIDIMIAFKLIFKHPKNETKDNKNESKENEQKKEDEINYIAPLYLPNKPSDGVDLFLKQKRIPFRRIEYCGFIHKQIILDFFQKYGKNAIGDGNNYYYWKNGLIIKDINSEQIVMITFNLGDEEGNAYIDITELNDVQIKHEFAKEIINFIKEVNREFGLTDNETEEMVTLDGIDFVSNDILRTNAEIGKMIFSKRRKREIEKNSTIKSLNLNDYKMFLNDGIKKKKVVISYSKKNLAEVNTLRRYLQPLVQNELIEEPWYCTSLKPADEWDEKIKHKFEEADIVIFMVSEYFYSTPYIIDKEIITTIKRYDDKGDVKIVPIILELYDWIRKAPYNLGRFSALPFQAKAISDFGKPKLAWFTISESIKAMIEQDLDPAKTDIISRVLEEIYERQVKGKLDNNF